MATSDLDKILPALISWPECLEEVHCPEFSHSSLPLLLGGLESEGEAGI